MRKGGGRGVAARAGAAACRSCSCSGRCWCRARISAASTCGSGSAAATARPAQPVAPPDHAAGPPAAGAQAGEKQAAAPDAGVAARKPEAEEPPTRHATEPTAGHEATHEASHEASHEATHEPAARRRGGERIKDIVGHDIEGLKMAPNPSLLPSSPAPPPAPKRRRFARLRAGARKPVGRPLTHPDAGFCDVFLSFGPAVSV